jgi:hypothetical protein
MFGFESFTGAWDEVDLGEALATNRFSRVDHFLSSCRVADRSAFVGTMGLSCLLPGLPLTLLAQHLAFADGAAGYAARRAAAFAAGLLFHARSLHQNLGVSPIFLAARLMPSMLTLLNQPKAMSAKLLTGLQSPDNPASVRNPDVILFPALCTKPPRSSCASAV